MDEFWRTLVESDEIVEGMERRGVSRATPGRQRVFRQMQQLETRDSIPTRPQGRRSRRRSTMPAGARRPTGRRNSSRPHPQGHRGVRTRRSSPKEGHVWPPIINLSEAGGYYFASRSAELRPDFEAVLRTAVTDKLLDIGASFQVDVIEVIGHTDERPVNGGLSNLDRELGSVTWGANGVGVQPADNAGLGLARTGRRQGIGGARCGIFAFCRCRAPSHRNRWAAHARDEQGDVRGANTHRDPNAKVRGIGRNGAVVGPARCLKCRAGGFGSQSISIRVDPLQRLQRPLLSSQPLSVRATATTSK